MGKLNLLWPIFLTIVTRVAAQVFDAYYDDGGRLTRWSSATVWGSAIVVSILLAYFQRKTDRDMEVVCQDTERSLRECEDKIARLKSAINECSIWQQRNFRKEVDELKERNEVLQRENEALEYDLAEQAQELEDAFDPDNGQIPKQEKEIQHLRALNISLKKQFDQVRAVEESRKLGSHDELDRTNKQLQDCNARLKHETNRSERMEEDLRSAQAARKEAENARDEGVANIDRRMEVVRGNGQKKFDQCQAKLTQSRADLKAAVKINTAYEAQLNSLRINIYSSTMALRQQRGLETDSFYTELDTNQLFKHLQIEITALGETWEDKLGLCTQELMDFKEESQKQEEARLKECENQRAALEKANEDLVNQINSLTVAGDHLTAELAKTTAELNEAAAKYDSVLANNMQLQTEYDGLEKAYEDMQKGLDELLQIINSNEPETLGVRGYMDTIETLKYLIMCCISLRDKMDDFGLRNEYQNTPNSWSERLLKTIEEYTEDCVRYRALFDKLHDMLSKNNLMSRDPDQNGRYDVEHVQERIISMIETVRRPSEAVKVPEQNDGLEQNDDPEMIDAALDGAQPSIQPTTQSHVPPQQEISRNVTMIDVGAGAGATVEIDEHALVDRQQTVRPHGINTVTYTGNGDQRGPDSSSDDTAMDDDERDSDSTGTESNSEGETESDSEAGSGSDVSELREGERQPDPVAYPHGGASVPAQIHDGPDVNANRSDNGQSGQNTDTNFPVNSQPDVKMEDDDDQGVAKEPTEPMPAADTPLTPASSGPLSYIRSFMPSFGIGSRPTTPVESPNSTPSSRGGPNRYISTTPAPVETQSPSNQVSPTSTPSRTDQTSLRTGSPPVLGTPTPRSRGNTAPSPLNHEQSARSPSLINTMLPPPRPQVAGVQGSPSRTGSAASQSPMPTTPLNTFVIPMFPRGYNPAQGRPNEPVRSQSTIISIVPRNGSLSLASPVIRNNSLAYPTPGSNSSTFSPVYGPEGSSRSPPRKKSKPDNDRVFGHTRNGPPSRRGSQRPGSSQSQSQRNVVDGLSLLDQVRDPARPESPPPVTPTEIRAAVPEGYQGEDRQFSITMPPGGGTRIPDFVRAKREADGKEAERKEAERKEAERKEAERKAAEKKNDQEDENETE